MAASDTALILSANPRGVFMEGTIAAGETPKPGTVMQIQTSEGMDGSGRYTWEAFKASGGQDGQKQLIAVLLEDHLQGKVVTDAYAAGEHCFLYVPIPGEELNMLVLNLAGTADDHAFGEFLMVDDGTGKLIASTGTPESVPFQLMEAIVDPESDQLVHTMYTGY